MPPEADRTCKRCSVARVNALIDAYGRAHGPGPDANLSRLRQIISTCQSRGFHGGSALLRPGLTGQDLRALCWNVSSFLEDHDVEAILGVKI